MCPRLHTQGVGWPERLGALPHLPFLEACVDGCAPEPSGLASAGLILDPVKADLGVKQVRARAPRGP